MIIGNFKNDISTDTTLTNPTANETMVYLYIDDVSLTPCIANGISNTNSKPVITVYPNPITNQLTVNTGTYEPYEIILYDLTSRKLIQQTFTNTTTLNTEQLAHGMYLYEVRNKNGVIKNRKVIKE